MAPKLPTAELLNNFAICNVQPITTLHLTKARTKRHSHLICCKLTFQNTQVKQLLVLCVEKIPTQCPFHKTYLSTYFHTIRSRGKRTTFRKQKQSCAIKVLKKRFLQKKCHKCISAVCHKQKFASQ